MPFKNCKVSLIEDSTLERGFRIELSPLTIDKDGCSYLDVMDSKTLILYSSIIRNKFGLVYKDLNNNRKLAMKYGLESIYEEGTEGMIYDVVFGNPFAPAAFTDMDPKYVHHIKVDGEDITQEVLDLVNGQ